MWINGIWIEHIKKPRRSKHLAYVARDYIEDADFEEITKGEFDYDKQHGKMP